MTNEKQQAATKPGPRGASLEKVDVWLPVEEKRRLEQVAGRENRSINKQAVHYIERGLNGASFDSLARKIDNIEALLIEALRRLDEK